MCFVLLCGVVMLSSGSAAYAEAAVWAQCIMQCA